MPFPLLFLYRALGIRTAPLSNKRINSLNAEAQPRHSVVPPGAFMQVGKTEHLGH